MTLTKTILMTLLWTGLAQSALGAPRIPASDAEIIERLPRATDPVQREFNTLRKQLAQAPQNLPLALKLAQRYIEQSRTQGDPRYLGYAQAALAPWYALAEPPEAVRVMRATLLQSTHQFPAALSDLDAVVKNNPANAQAWLTRATVLQVTGDYRRATQSCNELRTLAPALIVVTCLSNVASLTGQAEQAYARLKNALTAAPQVDPGVRVWVLTLLAEMAHRLGNDREAADHFTAALALDDADNYLLGAYADFLLDRNRAAQVVSMLKDKTQADALLLRYAIALRTTGSPAAQAAVAVLDDRFSAAKLRGDTVHEREHARFELQLMRRPVQALELAGKNWAVQKEPADARILLEAALAANDRGAAQPVLDWIKTNRLEDDTLDALAVKLASKA